MVFIGQSLWVHHDIIPHKYKNEQTLLVLMYIRKILSFLQRFKFYCPICVSFIFLHFKDAQVHYWVQNGNQSFWILWDSATEGRMCSQASKVLGTTMDRRRAAWLDQAQWGPGQRQDAQIQMTEIQTDIRIDFVAS